MDNPRLSDEQLRFLRDAANMQESKLLLGNKTILAERACANAGGGQMAGWILGWLDSQEGFGQAAWALRQELQAQGVMLKEVKDGC